MHLSLAASIALLPLLASSSPTPQAPGNVIQLSRRFHIAQNGVVNITALRAHREFTIGKVHSGIVNFEKNTGRAHPNAAKVIQRHAKRATGSDALVDDFDGALWHGSISVGTPATTFTVDFDTGSSDLFLPGPSCTGANCRGHKVFNTGASTTAVDQRRTFSLAFGDGSTVSGEQFSDTVSIAGLTATGQRVGAASTYSTGFSLANFPPDGLLGMGFEQISVFGANPVFQTLVAQGKTTSSVFGFTLRTSGSELTVGGTDTSKFTGTITFTPVTEVGFWEINIGGVTVGGRQVVGTQDTIVDTGTTLLIGDTNSVRAVYAAIPGSKDASRLIGSGFFTVPCASVPSNVGVTLGGRTFTISAATFNLGQIQAGSADCVGGLIADNVGFWILGDVFLQNTYTEFDVGNRRVGFATIR